jgi:hypothetical protein
MNGEDTYLKRQTDNNPLFSDVLWSRPEQKTMAGKIAIIGGSAHGFSNISRSYNAAGKAGAGAVRLLLPNALKRTLAKIWPECEFASSSKTGEFADDALAEWLELDQWSDAVLLPGDLGKSSQTAILMERYLVHSTNHITLTGDSISILIGSPLPIMENNRILLVLTIPQLQRLLVAIRYPMTVRQDGTMFQLAASLHALTLNYPWAIVTWHENFFYAAYLGNVSTTQAIDGSLTDAAAFASVWRMQQPTKVFEAITCGIYELTQ